MSQYTEDLQNAIYNYNDEIERLNFINIKYQNEIENLNAQLKLMHSKWLEEETN